MLNSQANSNPLKVLYYISNVSSLNLELFVRKALWARRCCVHACIEITLNLFSRYWTTRILGFLLFFSFREICFLVDLYFICIFKFIAVGFGIRYTFSLLMSVESAVMSAISLLLLLTCLFTVPFIKINLAGCWLVWLKMTGYCLIV